MKGLLVAVIVLAVALAVVIFAFGAAALAAVRKLRQLRATRDSQFLLRGDSVRDLKTSKCDGHTCLLHPATQYRAQLCMLGATENCKHRCY